MDAQDNCFNYPLHFCFSTYIVLGFVFTAFSVTRVIKQNLRNTLNLYLLLSISKSQETNISLISVVWLNCNAYESACVYMEGALEKFIIWPQENNSNWVKFCPSMSVLLACWFKLNVLWILFLDIIKILVNLHVYHCSHVFISYFVFRIIERVLNVQKKKLSVLNQLII